MTGHEGERGINLSPRGAVRDWEIVRANAFSFAAITVTESMNWADEHTARELLAARKAGMHVGLRHYARPGGAPDQARHAVRTGRQLDAFSAGALAPTLDVEATGVDDRFIKTWIKTVRHTAGIRRVLVYAHYEQWLHRFRPHKWVDDDVVLWLIRHNGIPGRPGWFHSRLGLHQHTQGKGYAVDALVYPFTLDDVLL